MIPHLPAGVYRLEADGAIEGTGTITAEVGTTSLPLERWPLNAGAGRLTLPTGASRVTIRGDVNQMNSGSSLHLRPEQVEIRSQLARREAARAAGYGRARVFFLDDAMYPEESGIWTRGDATGEFVVWTEGDVAAVIVKVTAGPIAVEVELSGEGRGERLALAPGESRTLQLRTGLWTITTRGVFRPKDHDRSSDDARPLGARLEFQ
jgi:hypothetical protein